MDVWSVGPCVRFANTRRRDGIPHRTRPPSRTAQGSLPRPFDFYLSWRSLLAGNLLLIGTGTRRGFGWSSLDTFLT